MFGSRFSLLVFLAFGAPVGMAHATDVTLNFTENDICQNSMGATISGPCSSVAPDSNIIKQSYGDIAGQVDVQYRNSLSATRGAEGANMSWWEDNYSTLTSVAYGTIGNTAEIFLKPAVGYYVTLTGFQLGGYSNADQASQFTIVDGLGNVLASSGLFLISGAVPFTSLGSFTSTNGIGIQFGPEAFNVGIDNIKFSVNAVPGPIAGAGLPVLLAAGAWYVGRRRRPTATA